MQVAQSTQASEGKFTATVIHHLDKENVHEPTVVLSHLNSSQYKVMFHPEQWSQLVRVVESALQTHYAGTEMEPLYSGDLLGKLETAARQYRIAANKQMCNSYFTGPVVDALYEASAELDEALNWIMRVRIGKTQQEAELADAVQDS